MPRQREEVTIPQQYFVADIKVNKKAQLDRTYTKLLLDAFVPYQEAMLVYLDELLVQHEPQRVRQQLDEVQRQSKKRSKDWEQTHLLFRQADTSEQERVISRLSDIQDEEMALYKTTMDLLKKLDVEARSHAVLEHKKEAITKLLKNRQAMREEGTWEKIGGKDKMSHLFSILGNDEIGFGFSEIRLEASPINDIYDWMTQYHLESLPPGEPFPVPPAQKKAPEAEKKKHLLCLRLSSQMFLMQ